MPRSLLLRLLALLAALAILGAACGGDDSADDAEPPGDTSADDGGDDDQGDDDADGGDDAGDGGDDSPDDDTAAVDPALCPVGALDGASGPVQIDLWHAMSANLQASLDELVAAYNASQDAVVVNSLFQGSYNENLDKYLAGLRGGDRPTLVQLEETALQLGVDAGSFVPMEACIIAADYPTEEFVPGVIEAYRLDGVLWPMPFNVSNPILYANATVLEAAGVTELPTTLDELRAASQAIVDAGAAESGLSLTASPWVIEQLFSLADEPITDNANGREGRATEMLIDTELGLEVFTWLSEMVADGLATYVGLGANQEQFFALATGVAGMTIDTTAALTGVLDAAAGLDPPVPVEVGPMPSATADRPGSVLVGGAALWLDAESTDEERAAAWDFLTWLNEAEQQGTWHAGTGYLPIRTAATELPAVQELWSAQPGYRVAFDQLTGSGEPVAGPVIGNHAQVREDAIVPALERMYLQGQDPAAALSQAQTEANAIIEDYTRRVS